MKGISWMQNEFQLPSPSSYIGDYHIPFWWYQKGEKYLVDCIALFYLVNVLKGEKYFFYLVK